MVDPMTEDAASQHEDPDGQAGGGDNLVPRGGEEGQIGKPAIDAYLPSC
jgi:hypothetical protein